MAVFNIVFAYITNVYKIVLNYINILLFYCSKISISCLYILGVRILVTMFLKRSSTNGNATFIKTTCEFELVSEPCSGLLGVCTGVNFEAISMVSGYGNIP